MVAPLGGARLPLAVAVALGVDGVVGAADEQVQVADGRGDDGHVLERRAAERGPLRALRDPFRAVPRLLQHALVGGAAREDVDAVGAPADGLGAARGVAAEARPRLHARRPGRAVVVLVVDGVVGAAHEEVRPGAGVPPRHGGDVALHVAMADWIACMHFFLSTCCDRVPKA